MGKNSKKRQDRGGDRGSGSTGAERPGDGVGKSGGGVEYPARAGRGPGGVSAGALNSAAASASGGRSNENAGYSTRAPEIEPAVFIAGLACLAIAVTLTIFLIVDHFGFMSMPGCGAGGGCAEVTRGKWGKVPGTTLPVSFVGFAYFTGLLAAWAVSRTGMPFSLRQLVRVGVLFSLVFLGLMASMGHLCWYCLGIHLANIGFLLVVELGRLPRIGAMRAPLTAASVFVIACGGLYAADRARFAAVQAERNKEADESVEKIIATSKDRGSGDSTGWTSTGQASGTTAVVNGGASGSGSPTNGGITPAEKKEPFTGRYRSGPEAAPVRMLMITDFQCQDCRAVEAVARRVLEQHKEVSLSIKHFPMDQNCNRHFPRSLHPNACWAARAAETAGILRGNEGFWEMHRWLFDRGGSFTDAELNTGLTQMGYDPASFIEVMTSEQSLALVQSDIEEAIDVGVFFTPMIFINGVHLRGVFEANADKLRQSVEVLLSQNLPALTAESDRKPTAEETCIGDWKEERATRLPLDSRPWLKGPANARMQIVMWGDLQEQWTPVAQGRILKWMEGKPGVSYSYRHFPFNQSCNAVVSRTAFEQSCTAAKALEAAGNLGGVDGYWKMSEWLCGHQKEVTESSVAAAAASVLGVDAAAFTAEMAKPEIASAVNEDCRGAKPTAEGTYSLLYRGGIPTVYINGKAVPRWRLDESVIIEKVLDAAYSEK